MKAYFSRRVPFYLLGAEDLTDSEAFDAYPVEVDPDTLANVRSIRRLVQQMEAMFEDGAAPEDSAEAEAAVFSAEVRRIFKRKAQKQNPKVGETDGE